MSYRSPQARPGTQRISAPNRTKKTSGSDGTGGPLAGGTKTGNRLSTNYPEEGATVAGSGRGGTKVEGQKLRGFVLKSTGPSGSAATDATVAADGTRRVRRSGG